MKQAERQTVGMEDIVKAHHVLSEVVVRTPLRNGCNVIVKIRLQRIFKKRRSPGRAFF